MIIFKEGSVAYNIVFVLSLSIEYPTRSFDILGNERIYKRVMKDMSVKTEYRNPTTGEIVSLKALNITGKGKMKSVHLGRGAKTLLEWMGMYDYYSTHLYRISGDLSMERAHRVAEVIAFFYRQGMLTKESYTGSDIEKRRSPLYYPSKKLQGGKTSYTEEQTKTNQKNIIFSRVVGVLASGNIFYPVYNVRDRLMKWTGKAEKKVRGNLAPASIKACGKDKVDSILMFGESYEIAMKTVRTPAESYDMKLRSSDKLQKLSGVYSHIYFVPFNDFGRKLVDIYSDPEFNECIRLGLYGSAKLNSNRVFEYDIKNDKGQYCYSFLDSDIARLDKFLNQKPMFAGNAVIYCFPEQESFLRSLLTPEEAELKVLNNLDRLREAILSDLYTRF